MENLKLASAPVTSHDWRGELSLIIRDVILIAIPLVVGFLLSVTGVLEVFGFKGEFLKSIGIGPGLTILGIFSIAVGFGISLKRVLRRQQAFENAVEELEDQANPASHKLSAELLQSVRLLYKQKNYVEVIRFGRYLSRGLWVSGLYKQRVALGRLIEESAARLGDRVEDQVAALVDDLGWTNAVLGHLDEAEKNIAHGVALAEENGLNYFAAKGERHRVGICHRYRSALEEAGEHLAAAYQFAERIGDSRDRKEMFAGLRYAEAELLVTAGKYLDAKACSESAAKLYEELSTEQERLVKCRSQMGRIFVGLDELDRAKDAFRRGLAEARNLKRRDEIGNSLVGLAKVCLEDQAYEDASQVAGEAVEIFAELQMPKELFEARDLKARAEAHLETGSEN